MNRPLDIQFAPSDKPADVAAFERGRDALCRLAVERVLRRRGLLPPGVTYGAGRPEARHGSARPLRDERKGQTTRRTHTA